MIQILRVEPVGDSIVAEVHLDTSKMKGDHPDPLYVVRHTFPLYGEGLEGEEYLTWVRTEVLSRAEVQLAALLYAQSAFPEPDPVPVDPPEPVPDPLLDELAGVTDGMAIIGDMIAPIDFGSDGASAELASVVSIQNMVIQQLIGIVTTMRGG